MNAQGKIDLWLGPDEGSVFTACLRDISHKPFEPSNFTIASDTRHPSTSSQVAALIHPRDLSPDISSTVSVIQPDDTKSRLAASLGIARRYHAVVVTVPGARYSKLQVRREVAEARVLIGVSSVGSAGSPGPLAIGLWTRYIDPRLLVPLLHPTRREPTTADVALVISPTLAGTLLIGNHRGYVVCVWTRDLVAAELAGLALWTANLPDSHDRIGPWEDPVVQRATELDLGVQLPSDLTLHPVWVGDTDDDHGIATLKALSSTIAALLNIDDDHFQSP